MQRRPGAPPASSSLVAHGKGFAITASEGTASQDFPAYQLPIGELVALRFLAMLDRSRGQPVHTLPPDVVESAWAKHTEWFDSRCRLLSPEGVRDLAVADVESAEVDPFSGPEIGALRERYGDLLAKLAASYDDASRAG